MRLIRHSIAWALAAFAACLLMTSASLAQPAVSGGQSATGTGAQLGGAVAATESASAAYVLGRDDVVEVSLLGRNDFGGRARVQADGTIQLPLIGKLQAADHSTSDLAETIRTALQKGGFFADPIVSIEVVAYASRYVTVLGAVGSPGLVPINRPYRLSEILARVGGVRDGAADYLVVRSESTGERKLLIRDLATGDASLDPYVSPGDKIYSPAGETFYIYGQVNSPGAYPLVSEMTVRQAIAKGGGLTESGSDKKVQVSRAGKKEKVDLSSKISPGDVLFIGERLF